MEKEIVKNNVETTKEGKLLGGITGKGFMPGQSGNVKGRPQRGLKEYDRARFIAMSDKDKEEFLKTIPSELRYRMAEGNPSTATDITSGGRPLKGLSDEELINLANGGENGVGKEGAGEKEPS